jgi:hypothetical protein
MTVYFEGDGNPRAATYDEVRDLLMDTLRNRREEILQNPVFIDMDSGPERDRALVNAAIHSVLVVLDGDHPDCPSFRLIPETTQEELDEAIMAKGNWVPPADDLKQAIDVSGNLAEYFTLVNN